MTIFEGAEIKVNTVCGHELKTVTVMEGREEFKCTICQEVTRVNFYKNDDGSLTKKIYIYP